MYDATRRAHSVRVWVVSASGALLADETIFPESLDLGGAASLEDLVNLVRVAMAPRRVATGRDSLLSSEEPAEGQRTSQLALEDEQYRMVLAAEVLVVLSEEEDEDEER